MASEVTAMVSPMPSPSVKIAVLTSRGACFSGTENPRVRIKKHPCF
jgi:hypothetical protein